MLETIKEMERVGQWAEIRQHAPALLSDLQGDQLARAYLALAKAYEAAAATPAEYRQSARYVQLAVSAAVPGSFMHTWALGRAAEMLADIGDFRQAGEDARAFFDQINAHPKAEPMRPWAHYAYGRVLYYQGRPVDAARHLRLVEGTDTDGRLSELALIWQAWALAAAGRIVDAFASIPNDVQYISRGHIFAAMARVCLAAHDLQGARLNARLALRSAHEWAAHDSVQIVELRLILQSAGVTWLDDTAPFAPCSAALMSVLSASLGWAGGVFLEAAGSSGGRSAGHKRTGLLGTVG